MSLILPWVALSWFMWSWKSTVWEALAKELITGNFIDIDKVISKDYIWTPISSFIDSYWMGKFRVLESEAVRNVLIQSPIDAFNVISLWWWAVTIPKNVNTIKDADFKIIYLDVPFEVIAERLKKDAEWNINRVPFDEDKFRKLYLERQEIYRSTADIVVWNTSSIDSSVSYILRKLRHLL